LRLEIGQNHKIFVEEYQGKYLVIFFSFKNVGGGFDVLRKAVGNLCEKYLYLQNSTRWAIITQIQKLTRYSTCEISNAELGSSVSIIKQIITSTS